MRRIKEGIKILASLGMPRAQQNERSALTLLAVLDVSSKIKWAGAKKRIIRIHDILTFIEKKYRRKYAENTRETIRRQTLHQLEQAGIVVRNPDDSSRPTNSPNTVYSISDAALEAVKNYGSKEWPNALQQFITAKGKLIDRYEKRKAGAFLSVKLPNGQAVRLSPGKHNELQRKIVTELLPRFCSFAKVLYVGDTARKMLYVDEGSCKKLGIPITRHDKLPDVILYDKKKDHLLLIEAVTSHGPVSPKRQMELEAISRACKPKMIYISAFLNFREFKRHIDNIAWETEVWIADNPDHMIHFNGPKFFTAY